MYIEYRMINDELHVRHMPREEFKPCTLKQVNNYLSELLKQDI